MKRLLMIGLLAVAGWQGYGAYKQHQYTAALSLANAAPPPAARTNDTRPAAPAPRYACDGRTYCSQMTSCAEATFFLRNCPGVQMDGDNDGVPCERQWCGH